MKFLKLEIIGFEKHVFKKNVKFVSIKGELGSIGILPGHMPLISKTLSCELKIIDLDNSKKLMFLSEGIIEIKFNFVTILSRNIILNL